MVTDAVAAARQALGRQLRGLREAAGYTQHELAELLGYSRPRVAGAEKGDGCAELFWQGCDKILYAKGALVAGFTEVETLRRRAAEQAAAAARAEREARVHGQWAGDIGGFSGKSHKFIAAHIGSAAVERITSRGSTTTVNPAYWMECESVEVGHSCGNCYLYLWPFGTAIFHLVEDLEMPCISKLALWRVRSYDENLAWATEQLRQLSQDDSVAASYVLSLYWVDTPGWPSDQIDTALKILCSPRVLLQRELGQAAGEQDQAEQVERSLLASGFNHAEIKAFGLSNVSVGYASWSGVVYYPASPAQSLTESELVDCELAVQAFWAYCEYVTRQVEAGLDPVVPEQYGWRFLRGARSRLLNPRPQETGQHRAMRGSIVDTSGLTGLLDQAAQVLAQMDGKVS